LDPSSFSQNAPGRLVRSLQGAWTFVPHPLPPMLKWSEELASHLSAADRALGQLAGVGGSLPNPHLLINPFVRREAVLSSQIEGTHASLSDLVLFEQSEAIEARVPDVREVANYVRALKFGLGRQKTSPFGLLLIRQLHQQLMNGVRGGDKTPGQFRTAQNFIGRTNRLEDARFVPPAAHVLKEVLDEFEDFLQTRSAMPPLARLAVLHYQFEAIHPFNDGNGRVGRLLITLILCLEGILAQPLLYLSAFFEKNRQEYYERLLRVSQQGEWEEWIRFFLRGVTSAATDAIDRAGRLLALEREYRSKVQKARSSSLLIKLIDALFDAPAITAGRVGKLLSLTPTSAQKAIDRLTDAGILQEVTGQKRNRIYLAREIVRVVDEDRLKKHG
jgi:Fic family protein